MLRYFLIPLLLLMAWPGSAQAQAQTQAQTQVPQCSLPDKIDILACPQSGPKRGQAGDFDYYVLALSWSPDHCATSKRPDELQCRDNRFGFVAHGLWPQYRKGHGRPVDGGWPQYCAPTKPPPADLQRQHLCRMPSSRLIACQWAKHGSCGDFGDGVAGARRYLEAIAQAMDRIALPALKPGSMRVGDLVEAMRQANPGLQAGQVAVLLRDGHLQELRICLTRDLAHFAACDTDVGGSNKKQKLQVR